MNSLIISPEKAPGQCTLKCAFNFDYTEYSNLTAQNLTTFIQLTPERINVPPVTYNSQKYDVAQIYIFNKSLHVYNENAQRANAEIVIDHTPVNGGPHLKVFIPCALTNISSPISPIISECASYIPNAASSSALKSTLKLNQIIPKSPFYKYISRDANQDICIVFGITQALNLTQSDIDNLNIISKTNTIIPPTDLYRNMEGANTTNVSNDGIYISCNPTGASDELVETIENTTSQAGYGFFSNFNSNTAYEVMHVIIKCIVVLLTFTGIWYGYKYIQEKYDIQPSISESFLESKT